MHTITILEGHSVHKQTSFRASGLFEDGLLNIAAQNIGHFFQKGKTCCAMLVIVMKISKNLGTVFLFSCKNTYIPGKLLFIATANQNRISVRSSINQTIPESMEVNICPWQCFCDRNTFLRYDTFRCSRHAHQESKLQLLT